MLGMLGAFPAVADVPPEKLFVVREGEELTGKEQAKRLELLRNIRFDMVGTDSVAVVESGRVPQKYARYARAFADSVSACLKEMPLMDRMCVLKGLTEGEAEVRFLNTFMRWRDSTVALDLSGEEAARLGVAEQYEELKQELLTINMFSSMNKDLMSLFEAACELPRSVFFYNLLFNRRLGDTYLRLQRAIMGIDGD